MHLAFAFRISCGGDPELSCALGKHPLLFTTSLSPAFLWHAPVLGGDIERWPLFHLLHPLMLEQASLAVPSAVSKFIFSVLLLIPRVS